MYIIRWSNYNFVMFIYSHTCWCSENIGTRLHLAYLWCSPWLVLAILNVSSWLFKYCQYLRLWVLVYLFNKYSHLIIHYLLSARTLWHQSFSLGMFRMLMNVKDKSICEDYSLKFNFIIITLEQNNNEVSWQNFGLSCLMPLKVSLRYVNT